MAILKGCVFDIDGTLADSMGIWGDIDRAFLEKRSIAMPDDYIDALNSMSFSQAAEYTIKRFSLDESPEAIMNEWKAMSEYAYAHTIKLKEGVPEFLEKLKGEGIPMIAATDLERKPAESVLSSNGILGYFTAVLTTKETGRDKSHPDIFLEAASRLGDAPERIAVFEDMLAPLITARSSGFITIGVYDASCPESKESMSAVSDRYIMSFKELL